ncbi:hypothetical protein CCM_01742 [Cordyceps militaris CM01]|uniref:Uncharacterized protein n=1 Tax=Cordyceps militaris (strain CM01) TaxID=983644 RepID=G3J710_CORMM|nr:uncharacterized protein CCM_01742 [Cordyceps militaris CM01]EGX97083.1 hypothetical protein CCM_01742 [Cordyceps militaris CM01]
MGMQTDESSFTTSTPNDPYPNGFIDLEAGCDRHPERPTRLVPSWRHIRDKVLASELKAWCQHPETINYGHCRRMSLVQFSAWLVFFFVYQLCLGPFADTFGFQCSSTGTMSNAVLETMSTWVSVALAAATAFLLGQGYTAVRLAMEKMENIRECIITLAYALIKTIGVPDGGHSPDELQLTVYECLALLVAYPVALIHQVKGNRCNPAVRQYCQQAAYRIKQFHNGSKPVPGSPCTISEDNDGPLYGVIRVEHYFELWSLNLEKEFTDQYTRQGPPSMSPQHILYTLRNHFENMIDNRCLDPVRASFVREKINMLALAGGESSVYGGPSVAPIFLFGVVDVIGRGVAVVLPIRQCQWIVSQSGINLGLSFRIMVLAMASALIMMVLTEMWSLRTPFQSGINTFPWTLGIASETDNMLNEFDESRTVLPVREHKYLDVGDWSSYSSSRYLSSSSYNSSSVASPSTATQ